MRPSLPLSVLGLGLATLAASPALAQSQNVGKTGSGGVLQSLDNLQTTLEQQWEGEPGRLAKGAIGYAGLFYALGAAKEALSLQGGIRGDGSPSGGSSNVGSSASTTGTSTSTSTSTLTN